MALLAYLESKGVKTVKGNDLTSSNKQKGREGWLPLIEIRHEIISPRDAASGLPTGKRQHKPFTVLAEMDQSWPMYLAALTSNDNIKAMKVNFYTNGKVGNHASPAGTEVLTYQILMENMTVASAELVMLNNKNPDLMRYEYAMRFQFCYEKISWTFVEGGKTAYDSWLEPQAS